MAWLHTLPSSDFGEWEQQIAQAKWIEERYFRTLARTIHGSKAVED